MKYIIDVPNNTQWIQWMNVSEKDGHAYFDYKAPEDLTPYTEQDREAIEDEVWEFASMLMNMHHDVAEDIYWSMNGGKGIEVAAEMTYQEAKAKYEEWKKEKEQFCVGDEVVIVMDDIKAVVLDKTIGKQLVLLTENGCVELYFEKNLEKTGRHFDEIEELLKKMGEES